MTNYEPISDWRIRINGNEHGVPHVHVLFRDGSRVSVAIETRTTLSGFVIPAKRLMPALAVIKANKQIYTSRGHNLRIYPPSGGRAAALQIACVERPHGAICALHRIPRDAAKSANYGRAKYTLTNTGD